MTRIDIYVLGESGVGKTALVHRIVRGEFSESQKHTAGVAFHPMQLSVDGEEVTVFIFDTSGEEKCRSLVLSYFRRGDGVLLVYDVTRPETFEKLPGWLDTLRENNEKAAVLIAGSKDEENTQKKVALSEVKDFAAREHLEYIQTSAKTGKNVQEALIRLARKVLLSRRYPNNPNYTSPEEDSGLISLGVTKELVKEEGDLCSRMLYIFYYMFGWH